MISTPNILTEEQYKQIVNSKTMPADVWNERFKPGMEVTVVLDNRSLFETTTRGEAWEIAAGIAVVRVEGKSGGYRLNRVLSRAQAAALLSEQK